MAKPVLTREDELRGFSFASWESWRNLAVYFCVFSVVGHWLEIVYCSFMNLFGIVDPDSLVWDDPMYPFLVYGVGVVVCAIALLPLKAALVDRRKTVGGAAAQFYVCTVMVCMLMELTMGFLLNQPDASGEYPLWDNSELPFNVFDQAWLVNDVALGAVAMLFTWVIYPLCEKGLAKVPPRIMNVASAIVVVSFVVLCIVKFSVPA